MEDLARHQSQTKSKANKAERRIAGNLRPTGDSQQRIPKISLLAYANL